MPSESVLRANVMDLLFGPDASRNTPNNIIRDDPISTESAAMRQQQGPDFASNTGIRMVQEHGERMNRAKDEGMLRPFVLLSSMSNAARVQIAVLLGWSMIEESYFGHF